VVSRELQSSWDRTRTHLLDARSLLAEIAADDCAGALTEFQACLDANELELALDALEGACATMPTPPYAVIERLALAAASMGLGERQRTLDARLATARGAAIASPGEGTMHAIRVECRASKPLASTVAAAVFGHDGRIDGPDGTGWERLVITSTRRPSAQVRIAPDGNDARILVVTSPDRDLAHAAAFHLAMETQGRFV
jgi:hypothetical protein